MSLSVGSLCILASHQRTHGGYTYSGLSNNTPFRFKVLLKIFMKKMSKNKKTYQGFKVDYLATKILISTSIHFSVTQFQIIVLLLVKTLHSVDWNGWRKQIFWAIWELLIGWESESVADLRKKESESEPNLCNNFCHLHLTSCNKGRKPSFLMKSVWWE